MSDSQPLETEGEGPKWPKISLDFTGPEGDGEIIIEVQWGGALFEDWDPDQFVHELAKMIRDGF